MSLAHKKKLVNLNHKIGIVLQNHTGGQGGRSDIGSGQQGQAGLPAEEQKTIKGSPKRCLAKHSSVFYK